MKKRLDEYDKFKKIDIDVGFRGQNTVVLTDVFQGRGYVKFYDINHTEFEYLVRQMKDMKKYSLVRNLDVPPSFMVGFDLEPFGGKRKV